MLIGKGAVCSTEREFPPGKQVTASLWRAFELGLRSTKRCLAWLRASSMVLEMLPIIS
jgi:hypothetical protein